MTSKRLDQHFSKYLDSNQLHPESLSALNLPTSPLSFSSSSSSSPASSSNGRKRKTTRTKEVNDDEQDLKRQRRKQQNRNAAHASRQRKKEYVSDLENQVRLLKEAKEALEKQVASLQLQNQSLQQQLDAAASLQSPSSASSSPSPSPSSPSISGPVVSMAASETVAQVCTPHTSAVRPQQLEGSLQMPSQSLVRRRQALVSMVNLVWLMSLYAMIALPYQQSLHSAWASRRKRSLSSTASPSPSSSSPNSPLFHRSPPRSSSALMSTSTSASPPSLPMSTTTLRHRIRFRVTRTVTRPSSSTTALIPSPTSTWRPLLSSFPMPTLSPSSFSPPPRITSLQTTFPSSSPQASSPHPSTNGGAITSLCPSNSSRFSAFSYRLRVRPVAQVRVGVHVHNPPSTFHSATPAGSLFVC